MQTEELAKYEVVKRALIADIEQKRLEPGSVVPSEAELRLRFKVSRPTLVRSMQDLVREGYVYRQQGRGTFVAPRETHGRPMGAESPASNALPVFVSSYTARLIGDTHEVLLRLVRGIEREVQKAGKQFILRTVSSTEIDAETLAFLDQHAPGPALVIEPSFNQPFLEELLRRGWQVCAVNEPVANADCVMIDQQHAGYVATKYLLDRGRQRVALLNGPIDAYWGFEARLRGYRAALTEAGFAFEPALARQGAHIIDSEAGRQMMRDLLNDKIEIDGVIGVSDAKAIGAMAAASEANISIPQDIAFVSIDNLLADRAPMPLPAVSMPFEALGAQAAQLVLGDNTDRPDYHLNIALKPSAPALGKFRK